MDTKILITAYLESLPEPKRGEMMALHAYILEIMPGTTLWFLDGKNEQGKVVSNPNIGYGKYTIQYANGDSRDFFQIGISANTSGISVYIMGIPDRKYLAQTYSERIGKASVTGYCIKFKSLKDIDLSVLDEAIRDGIEKT